MASSDMLDVNQGMATLCQDSFGQQNQLQSETFIHTVWQGVINYKETEHSVSHPLTCSFRSRVASNWMLKYFTPEMLLRRFHLTNESQCISKRIETHQAAVQIEFQQESYVLVNNDIHGLVGFIDFPATAYSPRNCMFITYHSHSRIYLGLFLSQIFQGKEQLLHRILKEKYAVSSKDQNMSRNMEDKVADTSMTDIDPVSSCAGTSCEKDPVPVKSQDSGMTGFKEDDQCRICEAKRLAILFEPCCHLISCEDCAQDLRECPSCHLRVDRKVRAHLSLAEYMAR